VSLDYEYISIFKKPGKDPQVPRDVKETNRIALPEWRELFAGHWRFPGATQHLHPAPFPEELPRRVMRMFSYPGDTVLDPFLGSGTTARVAANMGRSSVGYETGFQAPDGRDWKEVIRERIGYYDTPETERDARFQLHFKA
jgi:DNA modification methylase